MKKYGIAIAVAVAPLAFTACGMQTASPETTVTTVTVPETTVATLTESELEDAFVAVVASEHPALIAQMGKPFIIDFAKTICSEIDNGLTQEGLAQMVVDANVTHLAAEIGFLVGAGIPTFCPENQWFVDTIGS